MSAQDTFFYHKNLLIFDQNSTPVVFGILNVTPDSFFDGGKYLTEKSWLKRVEEMLLEGVDVIDIGAYSSRPGASDISIEEEENRLLPVIKSIKKHFKDVVISIDTFRSSVAEKSVDMGVNIINDIGGGTLDEKMFETIIKLNVPYILMHIQGNPQTMQQNPVYKNIVSDVYSYFESKIEFLNQNNFNKIIIDPGFGFGKTIEDNFTLVKNLNVFTDFKLPIMVGFSRKSMVTKILNCKSEESLLGTSVLNAFALGKGAKILRVHDVKEAKDTIRLFQKMNEQDLKHQ